MPTLYIMCGIPGSGKTTLAKDLPLSIMQGAITTYMSSDDIRQRYLELADFPNVTHQNFLSNEEMSLVDKKKLEEKVWTAIKGGIAEQSKAPSYTTGDIVLDATNTEQWILEDWFKFAFDHGFKPKVIVMSTPLNICIERNSQREHPVPKDTMSYMYNNFMMSLGWLYINHSEKIINSAHL